jgi:hypothetical protein
MIIEDEEAAPVMNDVVRCHFAPPVDDVSSA